MKLLSIATALVVSATAVFAQSDDGMSTGTVTKVDTKWNKVTIDHGPLENLDMPAMKMVFVVADAAMLEGLAEGTEIRFSADRVNGKLTVTEMEQQ
ncbi:copper-binding protein [Yangia mangrovi]|uniref:Copper-binding protein n=1 Tax=Alloyangia mangrovi TaxID=1779329 RepID=A0ABT2KPP4_9RHOB|nr:copper-binding protein [Alloyangia mangrovi]MCT4372038.1 copper-binding protein [Alloyangia mangrovi]